MSLEGKIAVVTGGSRGIGFAIAQALLRQGASVAITGTDQERLQTAFNTLQEGDDGARAMPIKRPTRSTTSPARSTN